MPIARKDGNVLRLMTGQAVSGSLWNPCGGHDFVFATEQTATPDATVNTNYYLNDHLGTTQMELSAGGWPVWQGQFTPFGQEVIDGNTVPYIGPQPPVGANTSASLLAKKETQNRGSTTTSGQASWSGANDNGGKGVPGLRSDGTKTIPMGKWPSTQC